jgi:hypothetical protein
MFGSIQIIKIVCLMLYRQFSFLEVNRKLIGLVGLRRKRQI